MSDYVSKHYDVFEMFAKQWALVAAGNPDKHNACTVAWGSLGTIWTRSGSNGSIVTVYLHPARFTRDVLLDNSHFTVSFYPPEYRKALGYMGSHSGRNETDKDIDYRPIHIHCGVYRACYCDRKISRHGLRQRTYLWCLVVLGAMGRTHCGCFGIPVETAAV